MARQRYNMYSDELAERIAVANPQRDLYEPLLREGSVIDRGPERPLLITGNEDIAFICRQPTVLGNGAAGTPLAGHEQLIPLDIDGDEHTVFRRFLDPLFAPRSSVSQIAQLEPKIRQLSRKLIGQFPGTGTVDLYTAFCHPLPALIFLELLGVPQSDLPILFEFMENIFRPAGSTPDERAAKRQAVGPAMSEYIVEQIRLRRSGSRQGGLISALMNAEVNGRKLTDQEIVNITFVLMIAGLDTVSAALSTQIAWFGLHPEHRRAVCHDFELLPSAIEELLRFETVTHWGHRYCTRHLDLPSGNRVEAGDYLQVAWAAGNLDEQAFERPFDVDLRRKANRHMTFARGVHRCLGSHLARLELRAALEEFLSEFPDYTIEDPQKIRYSKGTVRAAIYLPARLRR